MPGADPPNTRELYLRMLGLSLSAQSTHSAALKDRVMHNTRAIWDIVEIKDANEAKSECAHYVNMLSGACSIW